LASIVLLLPQTRRRCIHSSLVLLLYKYARSPFIGSGTAILFKTSSGEPAFAHVLYLGRVVSPFGVRVILKVPSWVPGSFLSLKY
jgi:TctA family transporter